MDECPSGPCCCGGVGFGCLAFAGLHIPGAHMPNVFLVALRTKLRTKLGIKVRKSYSKYSGDSISRFYELH